MSFDQYQIRQAEYEKDEEIERLKQTATDLQRECEKRGSKIADLERLLIRAADVIDMEWGKDNHDLVHELRKEAE